MANTTFNTRIQNKIDTFANWQTNNPKLLNGEIAIVVVPAKAGAVAQEPAILFKVGDGVKLFKELGWASGIAADVYDWAKAASKPSYSADEIDGLESYIAGQIQDTDTQYKIEVDADDPHKYYLYSKSKGGAWGTAPISTITIPADKVYTLVEGTSNGTVKFDGTDVKVHGLGSAAYTDSTAYDAKGAADTALEAAKEYANGKDTSIAEAKAAGDNAQTAVNALSEKVGTVPSDKTVVQMIEDAKTAASYDDTAVKASIKINTDAITKLNGADNVDGSVDKKIKDAINKFATDISDNNTIDTFKELIDYAASHQSDYSTLSGEVQKNTSAIATLNGKDTEAGSVAKTVKDAIDTAKTELQTSIGGKVDKEEGKGLSTNDYTTTEKTKLSGIAEGAQVNVIEEIQVNGTKVTPSGKKVNISVPTGALASKSEVAKTDLAAALKTEIEGKVNSADCGDIISHNASEFAIANHNHKIEDLTQTDYIIFNCGSSSTVI
jgi:hypothetical protein